MDPNTFPTKGNLILAKNSLALSLQGFDLMDKKRNILIREMMNLIDEAKDIQRQIDVTFREAYAALQIANMEIGITNVQTVSYTVPVEESIRIKTRSIMGVEIPLVEADPSGQAPTYAYYSTKESLDQARQAFEKVKDLTLNLSMIENSAYRLAAAIKKTQKRANALKNITIPHYTQLSKDIARITELFGEMPALYIADGHHRSAAAALVGAEKAKQNPGHKGDEEYNYFMAVCFPANQLTIIDYNRVVKDLNGLTEEQFVERLTKNFVVEEKGSAIYKPGALHNFSLYLGGKWYSLTAKPGTYDDNDPIGVLDVTISSNLILDEILGIKDLRSDKRIDFVGGIRGLGELKRRVDSGEMKVALALYPVTMKQLMDIADTGNIMPPKTTWFEPKLRSGLVIHKLD